MDLRHHAARFWREWVKPLAIVALVLGSLRSAIADWNDVPSGSMKPTILEGDRVFVNKLAYDLKLPFTTIQLAHWADPERGDIVVLWSPHDGKRLVKRVVAVPGDRIESRGQRLSVNGQPARYAPLSPDAIRAWDLEGLPAASLAVETVSQRTHAVMAQFLDAPGASFGPVTVPPESYFLMGDHRDNSFDSRSWGFAERSRIVGRATAVVLSLDHDRYYRPRWQRFFRRLS
jgi:signal peptidase I